MVRFLNDELDVGPSIYARVVIEHGGPQLQMLADLCTCQPHPKDEAAGWLIDRWTLDDEAVAQLVEVYRATLLGDAEDEEWLKLVEESGFPVRELLLASDQAKDDVTRADAVELAAAAALLAIDAWPESTLVMANSPMRSRAKSDSGIDAIAVDLNWAGPELILEENEHLYVASIKHSIADTTGDIRRKLVRSIEASKELTQVYMIQELRVLSARLAELGFNKLARRRVHLFARDWPDFSHATLYAGAGIDQQKSDDFTDQLEHLPTVERGTHHLRVLQFRNLALLHTRCP